MLDEIESYILEYIKTRFPNVGPVGTANLFMYYIGFFKS